jgi:2-polyprenyl-6-methoxyphenol hydroxylase-like FAD-dependent oxidoreductase
MRSVILGAGPAGLLFALLAERRFSAWQVELAEQNAADDTFGFGMVLSQGALGFLEQDAPDLYRALMPRMQSWPIQRIVHRDERVDIDGNGFSAIARLERNRSLQALCRDAGGSLTFGRTVTSLAQLGAVDLLAGADGVNSLVRRSLAQVFQPRG